MIHKNTAALFWLQTNTEQPKGDQTQEELWINYCKCTEGHGGGRRVEEEDVGRVG